MKEQKGSGVQRQLSFVVFFSVILASLAIVSTLYFYTEKRSYENTSRFSEEMIKAASMAFSQTMTANDEILLDALIHELQSRNELHIMQAYILKPGGQVVAHSDLKEYNKTYPLPNLLQQKQPEHLSEVITGSDNSFQVVSLLQSKGDTVGALVVSFSTEHVSEKVRSEMLWILGVTMPILILAGIIVAAYSRKIVSRLKRLQEKALLIGQGEWGEPIEVEGADEISQLTVTFNQMQTNLSQLREKDGQSTETIQDLNKDLSLQLDKVEQLKEQLADENIALREELRSMHNPGDIIGAKGSLRNIIDQARQLASLPVTVLILGESGTGKELLARFLHESGSRKDKAFITVNCAALPINLIESELFGHEAGSFTGATGLKKGKFEVAHNGTLFLDEIGELPAEAQAKLLRALQEGEIYRIGGNKPIKVDVRVLAATNRNLPKEVTDGHFREDLYYRMKVVELECPSLRERLEDIPILSQHFIETYGRKLGKPVLGISPSALKALGDYHWPGNIRELENMIERAVALSGTKVLGLEDFIFSGSQKTKKTLKNIVGDDSSIEHLLNFCGISPDDFQRDGWEGLQDAVEQKCLEDVLQNTKNQKEAAEALGLTPTKLHRLVKKYGLKKG